ncbi:lysophospholipid acyltransferase family protein [Arenicella xantha]|uniref:1-acyl-sn-glycerol-3-phosphate acyltransferase n=1 Tax=Arenicella xantha TaxID=644221 RepID=A0A395JTP4_9GAMM|nr:lysophospholipid acyltransferase family protein [Arenicella xantha]RBP53702.1 1-acyl-sn-glycerol-3-phosphate acyltransferase [Arenicella xantha]
MLLIVPALSVNHAWRILAAGICYILFAIGALLPGIYIFCLALLPIDQAAKQRRVRNVIQSLCRFYVQLIQASGLMSYSLEGERPTAISGHLVISNHTMLIDALFVLAYVENLCCVVKASLCHNPFTYLPIKSAGYISNGDPALVERAAEKIAQGENILIFPEGTRNQYDLQLDFKRGAANIAVLSNAPILPIVLCCMPRALGKGQKWYEIPKDKSKIIMQFHSVLQIAQCIDTAEPRTRQYRKLTEWLRDYYYKAVSAVVGS